MSPGLARSVLMRPIESLTPGRSHVCVPGYDSDFPVDERVLNTSDSAPHHGPFIRKARQAVHIVNL